MKKKLLSDTQILDSLVDENGENPPQFKPKLVNYRLRYRTVKVKKVVVVERPNDPVFDFVDALRIEPIDRDDCELILSSDLHDHYLKFSSLNKLTEKNNVHFGRAMRSRGIIKIRRTVHHRRYWFFVIRKSNLIQSFLKNTLEGDNERRQARSTYKAAKALFSRE